MSNNKLTIRCTSWRPLSRNTLRGFATVHIDAMKLEIRDVAVHQKGGARWAQLPSKAQVRDGALVKDASGKIQYVHVMDFISRDVRDAFSRAVVAAVVKNFPEAFADGGAA